MHFSMQNEKYVVLGLCHISSCVLRSKHLYDHKGPQKTDLLRIKDKIAS